MKELRRGKLIETYKQLDFLPDIVRCPVLIIRFAFYSLLLTLYSLYFTFYMSLVIFYYYSCLYILLVTFYALHVLCSEQTKAYLRLCQTPLMGVFGKIANGKKSFTIFRKKLHRRCLKGSKYTLFLISKVFFSTKPQCCLTFL